MEFFFFILYQRVEFILFWFLSRFYLYAVILGIIFGKVLRHILTKDFEKSFVKISWNNFFHWLFFFLFVCSFGQFLEFAIRCLKIQYSIQSNFKWGFLMYFLQSFIRISLIPSISILSCLDRFLGMSSIVTKLTTFFGPGHIGFSMGIVIYNLLVIQVFEHDIKVRWLFT